jgi:hypothetical protein
MGEKIITASSSEEGKSFEFLSRDLSSNEIVKKSETSLEDPHE